MGQEIETLKYISSTQDLVDLADFMEDEDLQEALDLALHILQKPEKIPSVGPLVVKFQAYSLRFQMLATTYTTIKQGKAGTDENKKKNVYYSMASQCHELAQSLKWLLKETR